MKRLLLLLVLGCTPHLQPLKVPRLTSFAAKELKLPRVWMCWDMHNGHIECWRAGSVRVIDEVEFAEKFEVMK